MFDEKLDLTRDEGKYIQLICSFVNKTTVESDIVREQKYLYERLNKELQSLAISNISLTVEEKKLVAFLIEIYELLTRNKYDVLRDHFHINKACISEEQIQKEIKSISQFVKEQKLDTKVLQRKIRYKKKYSVRKLYISDLHFFHDNLNRRMDMRGFSGYEEMNDYMIRQWNDHVTKKDEIFILGDFSISRGAATNEILHQLNGRKFLVEGNHDKYLADKEFDRSQFEWIRPYAEIQDNKRKVILSHYPVFCYNGQYRTSPEGAPLTYMLYGHVHNTHDERLVNQFVHITRETFVSSKYQTQPRAIPCNMINCFCMFSDYIPLTLDNWIEVDKNRRANIS